VTVTDTRRDVLSSSVVSMLSVADSSSVVCTDRHLSVNIKGDVDVARAMEQTTAVTGWSDVSCLISVNFMMTAAIRNFDNE